MIDFETDKANVLQKTDNIRSLADQVERLEGLQSRLELQEDNIKNTKKELEHVSGEVIPTMMSEMGLAHLKLMDGSSVDVKPNYSANITIANREAAFNWLRNNGLGDIIKTRYPYLLVATKITRQLIMLLLHKSVGLSRHKS